MPKHVLTAWRSYLTTASLTGRARAVRMALPVGVAGATAGLVEFGPHVLAAAIQQIWPAFALVTGLLLIGQAAASDNAFVAAGSRIASLPGGPGVLLAASLALVAIVTAVLNLDTAVVFLTPVLIQSARSRGLPERAFVYGTVLMSNSASLLLPGSNLTNLLVLNRARMSGLEFGRSMVVPWLVACTVTWLVVWIAQAKRPRGPSMNDCVTVPLRGFTGVLAAAAAAVLLVALPDPALPVLLIGASVTSWQRLRGRASAAATMRTIPPALVGLFVLAVLIGALGRVLILPATGGPLATAVIGAVGAVAINNLPAASLLSSHQLAHPLFLLLGLNLGPNLVITGSLSALLWLRLARQQGANISVWTYTRFGMVIVPLSLAASVMTLAWSHAAA